MATEVLVTDGVVRVTAAGAAQALSQAINVAAYDQADLILTVVGIEGTGGPAVTVTIMTGNALETEDGWYTYTATFAAINTSNPGTTGANLDKKNFSGLQKYIRWKVTGLTGGSPAASFTIRGMLRNN